MSLTTSLRTLLPLVVGLAVGGVGAALYLQSTPGAAGSPQARANHLELELQRATNRIAELEAGAPRSYRSGGKRTVTDGMRDLAQDIRDGRPVSPDDIFHTTQPLLRDLSPLFERMRVSAEQQRIDSLAGEYARKYGLSPDQQAALKKWMAQKSEDNAKSWSDLIGKPGVTLAEIAKSSKGVGSDAGLDSFMASSLSGDKLAAFKTDRSAEKAQRVQQEADMRVERLNSIVPLDDSQRDQVFGIMARNSPDYDPAMKLEGGAGEIGAATGGSAEEATLAVLRPEQRAAYQGERDRRRDAAQKQMSAIGLTLPANWDALNP